MKQNFCVKGLHCKSCEILIENTLEEINGVKKAEINSNKNELVIESEKEFSKQELNKLFKKNGYVFDDSKSTPTPPLTKGGKNWILPPIGIILIFILLNKLGFGGFLKINNQSSLMAIFIFGIIAGFSSCGALLSGIIVTYSKERWQILLGRIISYSLVGGILGLVGQKIAMGAFTNVLLIGVSLVMIIVSLQMMGVKWALGIKINLPKSLIKKIGNKKLPLIIGLLTVFLPCGFTLLTEGVAVMSGSFGNGLIIMLAFVLGSSIPLWLIGLGSEKMIKNQKAIGLLVLFLVFYNLWFLFIPGILIQNPPVLRTPSLENGGLENESKIVKLTYSTFGLTPSEVTVKNGERVRLEIEVLVNEYGCMSTIKLPGIFEKPQTLTKGKILVMEFTPEKTGVYQFTCAMGISHNAQVMVIE